MNIGEELEAFCNQLRRRQIEGALPAAKKTAYLMRLLTTSRRHSDAQALVDDVRLWGTKMQQARPFGEPQKYRITCTADYAVDRAVESRCSLCI